MVRTQQVHDCTGVPKAYLRKLLCAMGEAGLIKTKRGYQGGFALARLPNEITLLDVVEAVEPHSPGLNCLIGLVGCSDANPCPVHRFRRQEQTRIEAELARSTLADTARYVKNSHGVLTKCPAPIRIRKCRPKSSGGKRG